MSSVSVFVHRWSLCFSTFISAPRFHGIVPITDALVRRRASKTVETGRRNRGLRGLDRKGGRGWRSKIREYRFDMEYAGEFFNLSMGLLRSPGTSPPFSLPPFPPNPCPLTLPLPSLPLLLFLLLLSFPRKLHPTSTLPSDRHACLSIYLHISVIFRDVNP